MPTVKNCDNPLHAWLDAIPLQYVPNDDALPPNPWDEP